MVHGTGVGGRQGLERVCPVESKQSAVRSLRMGRRHLSSDDGNPGAEATPHS